MANETPQTVTLEKDAYFGNRFHPAGTDVAVTPEALEAGYREAEKRTIRASISAVAGDTDTLVGTAMDGVHLLLVEFARLTNKIANSKNLDEVKRAATDANKVFAPFLEDIEKGAMQLPYQLDGAETVIKEIVGRGAATTAAFNGQPVDTIPQAIKPANAAPVSPSQPAMDTSDAAIQKIPHTDRIKYGEVFIGGTAG